MLKIEYRNQYLSLDTVTEIKKYFDIIGDNPFDSNGPRDFTPSKLGWQGCWDRNLHLERRDNPLHDVIEKLQRDFGDFVVCEGSIRYLCGPFLPHSDIRSTDWLRSAKLNRFRANYIFLIPLWWKPGYRPATAFYNNPARLDEPLYCEMPDILPAVSDDHQDWTKNFSVRQIVPWQMPGDLIAWENFQWHGSAGQDAPAYDKQIWIKEFLSIETWKNLAGTP